ncbi:MAG: acyl-CoA dehydrogenase family protein [Chloroflexi bacterium]|nr:acyl-CoA dehydrogenase family protein [Chloroflexota bacterium]
MHFSFTPEQQAFRLEARDFAKRELPPGWLGGGLDEEYSEEGFPLTRATALKLGEKGWLAMGWPREYGGQAASLMEQLVYQEEMAYLGVPGTDMGVGGVAWIGPSLMLFGSEAQKREHLPPIASGRRFWCTAYSEPGAGSDLASLQCRARLHGGKYLIGGQKIWTSAGHIADWCWLAARTGTMHRAPTKHGGISLFLVDMKTPGVAVRPLTDMSGLHVLNEIFFDDVAVPAENLVGKEGEGWYYMVSALDYERVWPGIRFTSRARRMLDEVVRYVKGTPRGASPLLRQRLASIAVEVEVGRLMSYRLAWMQSQGQKPSHEASAVKVYVSELIQRMANVGVQALGLYAALSPSKRDPVLEWLQRNYLSCVCETILAGTSEIQRNIVATRGLGLPR